jgi:serine protease Do
MLKKIFGVLATLLIVSGLVAAPLSAQVTSTLPRLKESDPLPNDLFVKLAKMINPAVVNISTTYLPKQRMVDPRFRHRDPFFEFFEQFMGPVQQRPAESLGTGFVIREDGLIVTNNHVIEQADVIKVRFSERKDEEVLDAKVIGRDAKTDIALIKIESKKPLAVARMGTSGELEVGEWVAAFGNPYGHGHSMTKGIVSAIGREIGEINLNPFIQTDASINPGNSGGPLVNTQGLVIGVNTAIDPRAQGIGFAIPIDNVKAILSQLEKEGTVRRGFIGVQMGEVTPELVEYMGLPSAQGAFIMEVFQGSPAEKAGMRAYDVITEMDGQKIYSVVDVSKVIANSRIGKEVSTKVLRNGKAVTLKVKVGDAPETLQRAGQPRKKYDGQKAPFEFGFRIADFSAALAQEFGIPPLRQPGPVVIDVDAGGIALQSGLQPGDVILDVNRKRVATAKELLKALEKERNILRVLKRDRVVLIELSARK